MSPLLFTRRVWDDLGYSNFATLRDVTGDVHNGLVAGAGLRQHHNESVRLSCQFLACRR